MRLLLYITVNEGMFQLPADTAYTMCVAVVDVHFLVTGCTYMYIFVVTKITLCNTKYSCTFHT